MYWQMGCSEASCMTSTCWQPRSNLPSIFFMFWWHILILPTMPLNHASFQLACDIHLNSTSSGGSKYTYKSMKPSTTFPLPAENGWLHADIQEIKKYYLAAKVDCEKFLLNYTIDSQSLPAYWPDMKDFGQSGQPRCRGTPQLFEITKGLIAWPFGPLQTCPTYRKCWFGVLTCGRVDLDSMRALVHPQVIQRFKEIASLSDPIIHELLNSLLLNASVNATTTTHKTNNPTKVDAQKSYSSHVPLMTRWSIRALRLAMRVIGTELVIPEQRLVTLQKVRKSVSISRSIPHSIGRGSESISHIHAGDDTVFDTSDDVIIAQYTLTHPSSDNRLEIRQEALHLSALLDWDVPHRDLLGMDMMNTGSIYLGGTETRCRFFGGDTGCRLPPKLKKCVLQSYVIGTPIVIDAPDGSISHCPAIERRKQGLEPPLPLCKAGTGSNPGRWIQASALSLHPNRCDPNIGEYDPWPYKYAKKRNSNTTVTSKPISWMEASGDPCFIRSKYRNKDNNNKNENMEEELQAAHWFYAPYQCRYHFYLPTEAAQCFQHKRIKKVVLIGDSVNRDLFNWLTDFFKGINASSVDTADNVQQTARDKLKYITNVLKTKEVHFGGVGKHATRIPSISFMNNVDSKIHDMMNDLGVTNVKNGSAQKLVDMIITNHALAHKGPSYWPEFVHQWQSNEELFWKLFHNGTYEQHDGKGHTSGIPKYRIFQSPVALFGATRYYGNNDESFLRASNLLRLSYESLGFSLLSDYLLTDGKYLPNDDGLHFFGTGRQMEVNVLMNMICNDLLE